MAHNILISKIRCDSPNRRGAAAHNMKHLFYIATRDGTDMSPLPDSADSAAPSELYLKYINERPHSHGLFGNLSAKRLSDIDTLQKEMYQLSKNKTVYRGIISLDYRDAQELGYLDKDKWAVYLRSVMPEVAQQFSISIKNLEWVAAFHMEPTHPHIHYMFWDKGNQVRAPFISVPTQQKCRQILSGKMFEEERQQEILNKTINRDLILEFGKKSMLTEIENIKSITPGLSPGNKGLKITNKQLSLISEELLKLIRILPESGRLNYQYMPTNVKQEIDKIVQSILSKKEIQKAYIDYNDSVSRITLTYSPAKGTDVKRNEKAIVDLNKRLGNIVLKAAKQLLVEYQTMNQEFYKEVKKPEILGERLNTSINNSPQPQNQNGTEFRSSDFKTEENYQKQILVYGAYKLFSNIFSSILTENHRVNTLAADRRFRSASKQARKEAAIRESHRTTD